MKNLHLLQPFKLVKPGLEAQKIFDEAKNRAECLSDLRWDKKTCGWCDHLFEEISRKKYCRHQDCVLSAQIMYQPQCYQAKAYRYIHLQECACLLCGEIKDDEIDLRLRKYWDVNKKRAAEGLIEPRDAEHVSLYRMGYSLSGFDTDHITPISKGGHPLHWKNLQVVCRKCHRIKTANERRKKNA